MAQSYLAVQLNAKVHDKDIDLDINIIAELPKGSVIKGCRGHGSSNWGETARIDADVDGEARSYFLKRIAGEKGGPMLHGEFESMCMIHNLVPSYCPKPLAWGSCTDPNVHYLLFPFHELKKGRPDAHRLGQAVAELHTRSISRNPTGKWGFHITTYNGPLAQDNTWTETWEAFWIRGMKKLFEFEEEARGPCEELRQLIKPYFEKVCPRLLRPLESNGRHITPVLIHGDLWVGNTAVQAETEEPLLFDSAALWGHNECESTRASPVQRACACRLTGFLDELSYMRPGADDWSREYVEAYHRLIPRSEPQEDWEARNALYATRVIVVDSAIYVEHEHFRRILIEEIRKLVELFPHGYQNERDVSPANRA
ncbi:unnamed protein product [Clonostachys rosea f. rosea IK726]|uniref:Uncharacterized protein n=1 Tax=Clonostachys rosea f. rosea IK726 TaxID=1349383 RepID=A0ACA9TCM7_BIOOC|nr:unnamed protein product [Clonostachys rosea f. rosea IK726]